MKCAIYVNQSVKPNFHQQHNECSRYAKRYGYSIKSRVIDFEGNRFYEAIDKVVLDNEVSCLIVYNMKCIGDYETALFYKIYLSEFGKKLISCN